jgi:hypothetical protein
MSRSKLLLLFIGTNCFYLQERKVIQARSHLAGGSKQSCLLQLVYCLAYSSTLKMEAICFSKMSIDFHRITGHYIAEDRTLHNHGCEYFKSYLNLIASTDLKIPSQGTSTFFTLYSSHRVINPCYFLQTLCMQCLLIFS